LRHANSRIQFSQRTAGGTNDHTKELNSLSQATGAAVSEMSEASRPTRLPSSTSDAVKMEISIKLMIMITEAARCPRNCAQSVPKNIENHRKIFNSIEIRQALKKGFLQGKLFIFCALGFCAASYTR
jgi:hypothetical protein